MIKKVAFVLTAVLLIGLGTFLWKTNKEEAKINERLEKMSEEQRPLKVEQKKLEQQLEDLKDTYEEDKLPRGTTQLVFTDLSDQIYKVCYPIMKEYDFTGVLVVTNGQMPGDEGCMSESNFKELIKEGWTICIEWDEQILKNKWWNDIRKSLKALDMEPGNVVYFPEGTYDAKYDTIAQQRGFSIIMIEKTEEENPIQPQNEDGIWHIGAIGFMTSQPKNWLKQAVAEDGNVSYLVSFSQENQLYNETSFKGMMSAFNEYCGSGDLMVSGVVDAREHYIARTGGLAPEVEAKYQQEKSALETRLAEIETELQEIEAKYE